MILTPTSAVSRPIARATRQSSSAPAEPQDTVELSGPARAEGSTSRVSRLAERFVDRYVTRLHRDGSRQSLREPQVRERLVKLLSTLTARDFELLDRAKMTVVIADDKLPPHRGFPGNAHWLRDCQGHPSGGWYHTGCDERVLVLSRTSLPTLLHELGHVIDDALGPDRQTRVGKESFRSTHDHDLQRLYHNYLRRGSEAEWSSYARTRRKEYLAEGFFYLHRNQETRAELKAKDPGLYDYLVHGLRV